MIALAQGTQIFSTLQSMQRVAEPSFGLRHIVGAPIVSPDDAHDYWPATSNR